MIERAIGNPLLRHLDQFGYGANQWGFKKISSSRNLVLVCISSWILAICSGKKVGAYLGDIAAAFDRVCKEYLLAKLYSVGVSELFLDFLNSYLEPRIGYVTVEGAMSEAMQLCNMVFQGTVLGPPLWNVFFHDIVGAARIEGGSEVTFADDLSVFKTFDFATPNSEVISTMMATRNNCHKWGKMNRVTFDADKEHLVVIHPAVGQGGIFRLLGCFVDVQLQMIDEVDHLVQIARPKIKALLRTMKLYSISDMIQQFKTHIWGLIEYHTGAVLHTTPTVLARLDRLQTSFLEGLSIIEEVAFLDYNFAPTMLRRDIGILGFLQKRVLHQCHPAIIDFIPFLGNDGNWHAK